MKICAANLLCIDAHLIDTYNIVSIWDYRNTAYDDIFPLLWNICKTYSFASKYQETAIKETEPCTYSEIFVYSQKVWPSHMLYFYTQEIRFIIKFMLTTSI